MAITFMTKDGYKKKMEEIAYLENVKRPEISRAIAEARDKGDLSENAEYDAAKEAQGMLEMKISQLKDLVANARIIDDTGLRCCNFFQRIAQNFGVIEPNVAQDCRFGGQLISVAGLNGRCINLRRAFLQLIGIRMQDQA